MNGSIGTARFTDLGTRWINQGDVEIGTDSGTATDENGKGILEISSQAVVSIGVTASNGEEFTSGMTNVNELGTIELIDGGRLLTFELNNNGLIRGDGWIQASDTFDILPLGELRNAAGVANLRERIYVADSDVTVTNDGTIESLGGEMEFEGPVVNNLELIARDAIMRFNSGLINTGDIVLGGDTQLHPIGTLLTSGDIHVLSNSEALIVGDLTFSAGSLALSIGDAPGTLDVVGTVNLGGATLDLDYSAGVLSQPGDSYQVLASTEPISGLFSNSQAVADGRVWDILIQSDTVFVTATGSTALPEDSDFDSDGDVDGADFLEWQRGFGTLYDATDLLVWHANYGVGAPPLAAGAAAAAVPEPGTGMLVLLGVICITMRGAYARREW